MTQPFEIAGRAIGKGHDTYIIAELSANHCGDLATAKQLIHEAKKAGADAIKLQTYTADTMTIQSAEPPFQIGSGSLWDGTSLYELYVDASTPWDWHAPLNDEAARLDLPLFSSPFDYTAIEFLERLEVPTYKIASFELVDLPLIRAAAATGKPVILSTGMATLAEIDEAVSTARNAGCTQLALLHCNSAYPADPKEMNLSTIRQLSSIFDVPVGLSDHTLETMIPASAVCHGATIIEKHLCLKRTHGGPDAGFSLEPHEFKEMVRAVRLAEAAAGRVAFGPTAHEQSSLMFRRSIFAVRDIAPGEALTPENIRVIRPAHGLHPRHYSDILGLSAAQQIARGTPMHWDLVSGRSNSQDQRVEPPAEVTRS